MSQSTHADMVIRKSCGQPGTPIVVSFTGTAAESSALTQGVTYCLQASELCHISVIATGGTAATTNNHPIFPSQPYYITINEASRVLSVIRGTSTSGTLWLTPMSASLSVG